MFDVLITSIYLGKGLKVFNDSLFLLLGALDDQVAHRDEPGTSACRNIAVDGVISLSFGALLGRPFLVTFFAHILFYFNDLLNALRRYVVRDEALDIAVQLIKFASVDDLLYLFIGGLSFLDVGLFTAFSEQRMNCAFAFTARPPEPLNLWVDEEYDRI